MATTDEIKRHSFITKSRFDDSYHLQSYIKICTELEAIPKLLFFTQAFTACMLIMKELWISL